MYMPIDLSVGFSALPVAAVIAPVFLPVISVIARSCLPSTSTSAGSPLPSGNAALSCLACATIAALPASAGMWLPGISCCASFAKQPWNWSHLASFHAAEQLANRVASASGDTGLAAVDAVAGDGRAAVWVAGLS